MKRLSALLLALTLLFSCALAEEAALPASTVITASGGATPPLSADSALITLTVHANGETLADAESSAAVMVDALTAALLGAGAAESDIQSARGEVQTNAQYHYNKVSSPQWTATGFDVEYILTVALHDVGRLAQLVDAVLLCEANVSYTVTLRCSRSDEIYRQALAQAAQNAMEKARTLAEACGFAVENVLSVTEMPAEQTSELEISAAAQVCLNVR